MGFREWEMSESPYWDVFPPSLNLGQNFIRQQEVWVDRWKEGSVCI